MKTITSIIVLCLFSFIGYSQTTAIPDPNFEQALIDFGYDASPINGSVPTEYINFIGSLDLSNRNITDLTGIADFASLTSLECSGNQITSLNLSNNTILSVLNVGDNNLSYLNVKNGNNTNFTNFKVFNNTNLTCIEVDNAAYSTANWQSGIDSQMSFSEGCYTAIPDPNFEQALIDLGYDFDIDGFVVTESINTLTFLDVYDKNISDLTGIEDFTNLKQLYCVQNMLTTLDISQNTELLTLAASHNQLTTLDVSNNTLLNELHTNNNQLTIIDLSQNTALTFLDISTNPITSLDLSNQTSLLTLRANSTQLNTLDLSLNTNLSNLVVSGDQLTSLNVKNGNNTNFIFFDADNSPNLTCIEVDDAAYSTTNWTNIDPQTSFNEDCHYDETYVPDDNFEQALIDLGYDSGPLDDYVPTDNINTINTLIIYSNNISDLTGIEDFTALTTLNCSFNQLTTIDVSQLTALDLLNVANNQLTNIDVSQLTSLTRLNVYSNQLTSVDVSNNAVLTWFSASENQLTAVDVTNNTLLQSLFIHSNQIEILDLSFNEDLIELIAWNNAINTLDVSQNIELSHLYISSNNLTNLDLSANISLTELSASSNTLTSLNVKNGNNINFSEFSVGNNPNLSCIEVDDAAYSTANWTSIDPLTIFSEDCSAVPLTYVPDDNFEQALINLGYDSGLLDNYVLTANINTVTRLSLINKNINDLTGIEDFVALEELNCSNNNLTTIDLSQNNALTILDIADNDFTSLDLTQNILLLDLDVSSNNLSSLDITENVLLTKYRGTNNNISNINFSQNTALTSLVIDSNQLTTIDISHNTALTSLLVGNNSLTSIDISQNTALVSFYAQDNLLTSIDLNANIALERLLVQDNQLTNLDVSAQSFLTSLRCSSNNLSSLNLNDHNALTNLLCDNNQLTSLSVKNGNNTNFITFIANNNPNLNCIEVDDAAYSTTNWPDIDAQTSFSEDCTPAQQTYVPDDNFEQALIDLGYDSGPLDDYVPTDNINTVTILDITNENIADLTGIEDFVMLSMLEGSSNLLTTLNLTNNINLTEINCSGNNLTYLNVKNGNNINITNFKTIDNPNLLCIEVDNAAYSTENWTETIDPYTSFSEDCSAVPLTYVPDDNFEQALIDLGYDVGPLDDYVPTANINTILILNVSSKNIADLTGIEDFVSLEELQCINNQITALDISQNTALTYLNVRNNNLATLDVSQNTALNYLSVNNNQLTALDVSLNSMLSTIFCQSNQLTSLNVKNSNNTNIPNFNATNNPNLTCIEVDDAEYSTNTWINIDPQTSFSEDCSAVPLTYIPDDNFEQALIDLGYDVGPLDDYVPTANINTITSLAVNNKSISELTGIEDFVALTSLNASFNELTNINLTQNIALTLINVRNNQLTSLDVSNNVALVNLISVSNQLTNLEVNQNLGLINLQVDYNQLTTLDVSLNTNLTDLSIRYNQLTSLNVKNGNNTNIDYFNTRNNPNLTCIEVDDAAYSTTNWTDIDAQTSFSEDCFAIPLTYVPDDNFEQALIDLGYDSGPLDDYVPTANINTVTTLSITSKNISDLTGIEDFVALEELNCQSNNLTSLNLNNNTALIYLQCHLNNLSSLNINSNTALTGLKCSENNLSSLDVTNNTALTLLYCDNNNLSSLDITNNTGLTILDILSNNISTLDISNNTILEQLTISDNPINTLNVDNHTALTQLFCSNNNLSSLDVANNTALTVLDCSGNNLSSINVDNNIDLYALGCNSNNLTNLNLQNNTALAELLCNDNNLSSLNLKNGNNSNLNDFNASDNPNLLCIEVDDAAYSTTNWTNIDTQTSFSEYCTPAPQTYVPDDNFEQALIDLGYDSGPLDDYVPTANINTVTSLNVGYKNISDLTGIEDFVALTGLGCVDNQLTTLDLSQNLALETLAAANNQLTAIDLSQNLALNSIALINNELTTLDVSLNTALTILFIQDNLLTNLDVSQNNALIGLDASNNQLATLNVKNGNNENFITFNTVGNPNLSCVEVDDPAYSTTNWTNIDSQTSFSEDCSAIPLTYVPDDNFEQALIDLGYDVGPLDDYVPTANINSILTLDVGSKNITDLTGIEDFVALEELDCYVNNLSSIDISNNSALTKINCESNAIESLDISNNPLLTQLVFIGNNLSTLDVSNNTALTYLDVSSNNLSNIDLSNNPLLTILFILNNNLTSLDLSNNAAITSLWCQGNAITSLDVSSQTGLRRLRVYNNQLTSLNVKNGNNSNITQFEATGNANLTCIEVDNATYSTANWSAIDSQTSFSEDCSLIALTYVPDDNFEQALIDLGYDSGPLDDYVPTQYINNIIQLNIMNENISDLTGIEAFVALEKLVCLNNQLTSLDLSNNVALSELICYNNDLTSLNIANNPLLTILQCYNNDLTVLDVSNNPLLEDLRCSNSLITTLDVTNNPQLKTLITNHAALTSLDLSNNTLLELLNCGNNQLTSLNVDNNTALTDLNMPTNMIASLDVSNNPNLAVLNCTSNNLTEIDLSYNPAMTTLNCRNNQLTSLNLKNGNNTAFTYVTTTNNPNLECIEVDDVAYSTTNWTNIDSQTSFSENCSTLSVSDINEPKMHIYPNPASNLITIDYPLDIEKIEFYSLLGKLVLQKHLDKKINISNLSDGMFLIKIYTENGVVTKKIVKKSK